MRTLAIFTLGMLMNGAAIAGPFGWKIGQSLQDLGLTPSDQTKSTGVYQVTTAPAGSNLIDFYSLTVGPTQGLCKIGAAGNDVQSSSYGTELRSAYNRFTDIFDKKFGGGKEYDFLYAGSIWDDRDDFMMGLLKKERTLTKFYSADEGSVMTDGLRTVMVDAKGLSTDKGYIAISYEFSNVDQCIEELEAMSASVF